MEYTLEKLKAEGESFLRLAGSSRNLEVTRERLFRRVTRYQFDVFDEENQPSVKSISSCSRLYEGDAFDFASAIGPDGGFQCDPRPA